MQKYYGYEYLIPTHQGRGAENILSQILIKDGDYVPGNMYFTTTRLHQELAGGTFRDVIIDEAHDPASEHPFKGNIDLAKVEALVAEVGADRIPYITIGVTVNLAGGQPVSMANLREVSAYCREHGHPRHPRRHARGRERLLHPAARRGLRRQDRRARSCARSATCPTAHDVGQEGQPRQHRRLARRARQEGRRAGAEPRRGLRGAAHLRRHGRPRHAGDGASASRRRSRTTTCARASARSSTSASSSSTPASRSCARSAGTRSSSTPAAILPHIPRDQFPAQALAAALYVESGIRAMERGAVSAGRDPKTGENRYPKLELVRLTIPRRVYTQAHMDVTAESVMEVFDEAEKVRGLEFNYEPEYLRFFQARFDTVGGDGNLRVGLPALDAREDARSGVAGAGVRSCGRLPLEQHLHDAALGGSLHRFDGALERVALGDQRRRVDVAALEQAERRRERAAARADDGDLVDDERREVERDLARVGRLEHERAARPERLAREVEPARGAGGLDDDVVARAARRPSRRSSDVARAQERPLECVAGDDVKLGAGEREHLRDELAEAAGADEQHAVGRGDVDLLQDLERRGERLGEDRCVVAHAVGHAVQVRERQTQVLGVRAVAVDDSEHGSRLAVGRAPAWQVGARAARGVDLADDTRAEPLGVRRLDDLADELVAEDSRVGVVAARQLEVGAADARERDADERLPGARASGTATSRTDRVLSSSHSAFTGLLTRSGRLQRR